MSRPLKKVFFSAQLEQTRKGRGYRYRKNDSRRTSVQTGAEQKVAIRRGKMG